MDNNYDYTALDVDQPPSPRMLYPNQSIIDKVKGFFIILAIGLFLFIVGYLIYAFVTGECLIGIPEAFCKFAGLINRAIKEFADLGHKALNGTFLHDVFSFTDPGDKDWESRRFNTHMSCLQMCINRKTKREKLTTLKIPGKHTDIYEYIPAGTDEKSMKDWNDYIVMLEKQKLGVYCAENKLLEHHFINNAGTKKDNRDPADTYKNVRAIEAINADGNKMNIGRITGSLAIGAAVGAPFGPAGVAAGLIAGYLVNHVWDSIADSVEHNHASTSYVIPEGFYSTDEQDAWHKDAQDGADPFEGAGHVDLGGESNIDNDEIQYVMVPPNVVFFVTNMDSFKFDPHDDSTYWCIVGPWEGNLPPSIKGKASSLGVFELRRSLQEWVSKRGTKLNRYEIINEFDFQYQRWKYNKWKKILDHRCGKSNDAVLIMEDKHGQGGDWWCAHAGTHVFENVDDHEGHKDDIAASGHPEIEPLDWLEASTGQLNPVHQHNYPFKPGDLQLASKCFRRGEDKTGYEDCELDDDEGSMIVVPPRWAFYAQGENKNIDRFEGMWEVTGPHMGTIWNTGLGGWGQSHEHKDRWNQSARTMKDYWDRDKPESKSQLRQEKQHTGKASGFRLRRIGETPCTGCGCFTRQHDDTVTWDSNGRPIGTNFVERPFNEAMKDGRRHSAGAGEEFRTEEDKLCPGGWYRENREHWNMEGVHHGPRIHTKEQCVALNKDNSRYEYMWRECTNDVDIEPVDAELLISVKDLNKCGLENYVIKSGPSNKYYHRN